MPLDVAIRKQGFRRWYERQLFESHAYLVTGLLALIMTAIALEVIEFRQSAAGLLLLLIVAASGGTLCLFAWGRFHRLLARAEHVAGQARCPRCDVYGKFGIVSVRDSLEAVDGCALQVRCVKCDHEWTIA
ncbi:MAG: hypothetical protein M3R31_05695 [Pseudomonadota bacterium]|nr:hypothetical protein [Pseudomonadota bacterium]